MHTLQVAALVKENARIDTHQRVTVEATVNGTAIEVLTAEMLDVTTTRDLAGESETHMMTAAEGDEKGAMMDLLDKSSHAAAHRPRRRENPLLI